MDTIEPATQWREVYVQQLLGMPTKYFKAIDHRAKYDSYGCSLCTTYDPNVRLIKGETRGVLPRGVLLPHRDSAFVHTSLAVQAAARGYVLDKLNNPPLSSYFSVALFSLNQFDLPSPAFFQEIKIQLTKPVYPSDKVLKSPVFEEKDKVWFSQWHSIVARHRTQVGWWYKAVKKKEKKP